MVARLDKIAYLGLRNAVNQVFLYDFTKREETQLTTKRAEAGPVVLARRQEPGVRAGAQGPA